MLVRRERGETLDDDRERTRRFVEDVRNRGVPGLRVWTPPSHVSFGRRDANSNNFQRVRTRVEDRGYPTAVRQSGGRAVVHTEGTLAVLLALPTDDGERITLQDRYDAALECFRSALKEGGVEAERGEPPNSFCPGSHSLQIGGCKVLGLAQRVRRDVAMLTAILIVRDEGTVADVLEPIYEALGVPFDPTTVGSLTSAGGSADRDRVGDAIVAAFEDRFDQ